MIEKLDLLDKKLLLFFNGYHTYFLDTLMYWISRREVWVPFYLLLIYFIYKNFRTRSLQILLTVALLVTASDQVSTSIFKPQFQRLRPCHDPSLEGKVIIVEGCGSKYGFVSSHAANTFGVAAFLSLLFYRTNKNFLYLFIWAVIVSYSRVYLGVHYPGDVLVGGILGIVLGIIFYLTFKKVNSYFDQRAIKKV